MAVKTHPIVDPEGSVAEPSNAWDSSPIKKKGSSASDFSDANTKETEKLNQGSPGNTVRSDKKKKGCCGRVWDFVEDPGSSKPAFGWSIWIMLLIFISTVTLVLETLPELSTLPPSDGSNATALETFWATFNVWFWIETFCIFNFTMEFMLRFFFSPKKLKFVKSPMNIVDFFAIIPYYIEMPLMVNAYLIDPTGGSSNGGGIGDLRVIRVIRLTRVFRVMKMGRYMSGATLVKDALISSSDALALLGFSMFIALIIFASGMYYLERGTLRGRLYYIVSPSTAIDFFSRGAYFNASDPNVFSNDAYWELSKFQSIPDALWWCFATVTTVGYGDIYPTTVGGKILGTVTMFAGILVSIENSFFCHMRDVRVLVIRLYHSPATLACSTVR
uniref:Ion transport domain-containing protein n=1 Tax=Palpitomonas bilix TaxID=652834 RepID=A0A7S3DA67_9EUKA|mmetsp:Transcript_28612/g.72997  ORF Transcript_28612/g.72997 Transcript_28612/m.72997 type:complete len:388 (+) Transcript_28612:544-1707(+)